MDILSLDIYVPRLMISRLLCNNSISYRIDIQIFCPSDRHRSGKSVKNRIGIIQSFCCCSKIDVFHIRKRNRRTADRINNAPSSIISKIIRILNRKRIQIGKFLF